MGRALLEGILQTPALELSAALEQAQNPYVGKDAGELIGGACGIKISSEVDHVLPGSQVLIDFTRPEATLTHLALCRQLNINMVIGTTGFTSEQTRSIAEASKSIGIVFAPNMSVGVNLTFKLLELAAQILQDDYDIEIIEAHHRHKVDAPSGTALKMGEILAKARKQTLEKTAIYERHGIRAERARGAIGFASVRGGDIVGDHTVMFAGNGERIEITHKAHSRTTFAQGALRAARFISAHSQGLFDMQDVLGL